MRFDCAKIHQVWAPKPVSSPEFSDLLGFLAPVNVPLFIHLGSVKKVDPLIEACRRFPSVPVIVAHCIGLERFIARQEELPDHLYFDVSNAYFVSENRIRDAVATFGPSWETTSPGSLKLCLERKESRAW